MSTTSTTASHTTKTKTKTEAGSVFVSNYPPYRFWNREHLDDYQEALKKPPVPGTNLGLYMHIPFCRKRCKFCYYSVHTDKNAADINRYLDALTREIEYYGKQPVVGGRPLHFVYFGGGTPSYLSAKQLESLVSRVSQVFTWDQAEEVTFECEPGTLSEAKLDAIKGIGVTRLSLGIENLNDEILKENGRAHVSKEVYRVLPWIRERGFDQLNVDLIAGMVGDTWDTWKDTVQKTIDLDPDSVTIYQLELPLNTVYVGEVMRGKDLFVADWETKREWHAWAFEQFEQAGFTQFSGYTMVKNDRPRRFLYVESLWGGSDMIPTGSSSFGVLNGVLAQNAGSWPQYLNMVEQGELPLSRAFAASDAERLTRQMILQLKTGSIRPDEYRQKFGVDILDVYSGAFNRLKDDGMLEFDESEVRLSKRALLRVDELLYEFFAPEYCVEA